MNTQPYVPPGAQEQTREQVAHEAAVQAQLADQRERVAHIQATKQAMMYTPTGLRALFPTNNIRAKVTTTTKKRAEHLARKQAALAQEN